MTDIEIIGGEAWNRHERILSLIQQWRLYTLEIGKELYEMRETEGWRSISRDYENYSDYLDDYGIRRTFASQVTKVYEVYQLGLGIASTQLLEAGIYKLEAAAKYTNKETISEILASASTQTLHKFRRWLKERFRPDKASLPTKLSEIEYSGNDWRLIHGDMVDICKAMPTKSFDAIVTDPPYPGEYLHLFSSLAEQAERLLVDGGVLVVMSGQTHLPEVYERLTQHEDLQYRWTVAYLMPGKTDVRVMTYLINPEHCALEDYSNIDCCTDMDWHHIISFSMARGNKEVRKILKANPPELMAWVCATHNRQRWADGRKARAILLIKRNKETEGKTKETVDSLPWKVKKYADSFEAMTC